MGKNWVETWQKTSEKPKIKPEIAETFNWSKEERQKLNENVLIENVRKRLIAKYPEQKSFFETAVIKVMQLWKDINEYTQVHNMINTNIFLLYSQDWKLLSYIDQEWNTMFDVSSFNFDEDLKNLYHKKQHNTYIRKNNKTWKLELFDNWKTYNEWSENFNDYIFSFLPLWRYFK